LSLTLLKSQGLLESLCSPIQVHRENLQG
jgi:hypothetical protein